jgi:hypothetical protein
MRVQLLKGAKVKRPLAPRGGNDRVYTPLFLACKIVEHFRPAGRLLEPCAGRLGYQPFVYAVEALTRKSPAWCEIDEGRDFFDHHVSADWIITNPPWSKFRPFLMRSMQLADNVVFLSLLNAWFMRARLEDIRKAGFGFVEALMLPTPPKPWPQTGFQLAAVHIRRGHTGPMKFTFPGGAES